jgi:hypothetical protein
VAEELALEHGLGQGGAVERDEVVRAARRVRVDRPRHELLARAALAEDEDRRGGGRDLAEDVEDRLHLLAAADDAFEAVALVEGALELDVREDELPLLEGLADLGAEDVEVDRLVQVVVGALVHRLQGGLVRGVAGEHDDLGLGGAAADVAHDVQSRHVAHDQVGEDQVEALLVDELEALGAAGRDADVVAGALEAFGGRLGVGAVVVED